MKHRAKILIVDDERFNINLLVDLLDSEYELMVAKNGKQAIKRAKSDKPPDLILLDIMMPEMDGYEVCRTLKADPATKNIPIIFITAMGEINDEEKGLDLGAVDYITKPISPPIVMARMRTHLALSKTRQELDKKNQDLLEEREFIEDIIIRMRAFDGFDQKNIRFLQAPVEKTSGDLILSGFRPDGAQYVVLGDFTGHGLPAATSGPMASDIFYAMTRKGLTLAEIMAEMNIRLYQKTPASMFMAGGFLELDSTRRQLFVWNCSIPDILVFRDGAIIHRVRSQYFARGMIDKPDNPCTFLAVEPGDRVFAYTDGFTEETNADGDMFGADFFEKQLTAVIAQGESLDVLKSILQNYRDGLEQTDDMTMIELTC
jgi:two-component system, HptB-dependent secretion and biofilm response regulator